MEKEEKIVVILMCMALLSLAIAYVTFFSGESEGDVISFSSSSLPGDIVQFEGEVFSKHFTYTGGHLLLDVDYGSGVVSVFIPSNNGADDVDSRLVEGDLVSVRGSVQEYGGELEVVVMAGEDVVVLS